MARKGLVEHPKGAVRGPAKPVDRLVVVPHGGDVEGGRHQPSQQLNLGKVGILEFIHQEVAVLPPAALEHFRIAVQQPDRFADQAPQARISRLFHQPPARREHARQFLLFLHLFPFEPEVCSGGVVGAGHFESSRRRWGHRRYRSWRAFEEFLFDPAHVAFEALRLDQFVLAAREEPVQVVQKGARLRQLSVKLELQLLHATAQEDPDIDRVEQAPVKIPLAQEVIAKGVEGRDARSPLEARKRLPDPSRHLARRFLGEG